MSFLNILLLLFCVVLDVKIVFCERQDTRHMLYETFPSAISCFRVLNGTHQFGCSSDHSGNLGVVHIINSAEDVDWLFSSDAVAKPYMAVVSPLIFSKKELMAKLRTSDSVSGILLAMNGTTDRPQFLSPDDTCPNRYSGLAGTCNKNWNPHGLSYMFEDWAKPIFFVNDVEVITKIHECFQRFNLPLDKTQSSRNLCSLQMKGHMFAAVNTPTCISRSNLVNLFNPVIYCDPMGDRNIVNSLFPIKDPKAKSLIVVTTHLDVATMFDGLAPAAMSTVTGIVTLMATNHLLSKLIPNNANYERNVLFLMFSGEAYDYIGSSRFVYDIKEKLFRSKSRPIVFDDIGLMFEINQLDKNKGLFLHHSEPGSGELFSMFNETLRKNAAINNFTLSFVPAGKSPPPASVQSFLKERPDLPYFVATNYEKQFANMYYSSMLDNSTNIEYVYINGSDRSSYPDNCIQSVLAGLATVLAKTLYKMITSNDYIGNESVEPKLMDELMLCYLEKKQCQLFTEAFPYDRTPLEPSSLYVGVARSNNHNILVTLTQSTLVNLTGTRTNKSHEECIEAKQSDGEYEYLWITGKKGLGECFKSNSKFTDATSPAFLLRDYDWSSGVYSSWSESVWQDLGLVMFLKPSRQQEALTLVMGLIVLIISFVTVYWIKSRASFLFHTKPGVIC